jgi:hypothetical protein
MSQENVEVVHGDAEAGGHADEVVHELLEAGLDASEDHDPVHQIWPPPLSAG